ncbi:MAG: hypothetical protein HY537_06845 [Deltaproteobacteria bacterium]|nr:hypothetical protein [Deltaproteobacteria bacterium]
MQRKRSPVVSNPTKKSFTMRILLLIAIWSSFLVPDVANARDIFVKGYHKRNGTWVKSHMRSNPDQHKWNNLGPSNRRHSESYGGFNVPRFKDRDGDGIANQFDFDDDNDGIADDFDSSQYGR